MRRRTFIGALPLAGVAPAVAVARPSPIPEAEVDAFLAELDHDLERLSRTRGPRPLRRFLAKQGLRPGLLGDTLATLQLASDWHDSSEAVQAHAGFQQRLIDRAARLGADLCALSEALMRLPRETRRTTHRMLRRPNRSLRVLEAGFLGKDGPMLKRRRAHLRGSFGNAARMAARSDDLVVELVDALDHMCEEAGTTRQAMAALRVSDDDDGWDPDDDRRPQAPDQTEPRTLEEAQEAYWQARSVGLKALGLALTAGGLAFIATYAALLASTPSVVGIVIASVLSLGVAPILLLVSIVAFITARVIWKREVEGRHNEAPAAEDARYRARLAPLYADPGPLPA